MSTTSSGSSPDAKGEHEPGPSKTPLPGRPITFLALPGEIRTQIYHLIVPESRISHPHSIVKRNLDGHKTPQPETLALARTCKQIYGELSSVYFGERFFHFDIVFDMFHYLNKIGPTRRSFITSVRVLVEKDHSIEGAHPAGSNPMREQVRDAFNLLGKCTSLKTLYIQVNDETRQILLLPYSRRERPRNVVRTNLEYVDMLLELRNEGVFAGVYGREDLELKVRESFKTSFASPDLFEGPMPEVSTREELELQSFEELLRSDMRGPENTALWEGSRQNQFQIRMRLLWEQLEDGRLPRSKNAVRVSYQQWEE